MVVVVMVVDWRGEWGKGREWDARMRCRRGGPIAARRLPSRWPSESGEALGSGAGQWSINVNGQGEANGWFAASLEQQLRAEHVSSHHILSHCMACLVYYLARLIMEAPHPDQSSTRTRTSKQAEAPRRCVQTQPRPHQAQCDSGLFGQVAAAIGRRHSLPSTAVRMVPMWVPDDDDA